VVRPLLKKHSLDRRQPDEELQASIESAFPVETAGENRSESPADLHGQQRQNQQNQI